MIEKLGVDVPIAGNALSEAIDEWIGQPEHWWIEPMPLFRQSKVKVWGQGELPADVFEEFWAWGRQGESLRAMHGVRGGKGWSLVRYEGDGGDGGAPVYRSVLASAASRARYHAAGIAEEEVAYWFDAGSGGVLLEGRTK